jgi:hypothetical protein
VPARHKMPRGQDRQRWVARPTLLVGKRAAGREGAASGQIIKIRRPTGNGRKRFVHRVVDVGHCRNQCPSVRVCGSRE